jgi:hypothetical protein
VGFRAAVELTERTEVEADLAERTDVIEEAVGRLRLLSRVADVGAVVVAFEVVPSQIRREEISRETGGQGGPELWPRARQKLLTERPLDAFDRSRCSFLDSSHSS